MLRLHGAGICHDLLIRSKGVQNGPRVCLIGEFRAPQLPDLEMSMVSMLETVLPAMNSLNGGVIELCEL